MLSATHLLIHFLQYMARALKGKQRKGKKAAVERRPQGHQNAFSGAKLDFLESYKDQFLDSTDRGAFYTFVSKAFIERFGYNLAIEANPDPDDDDMLTPEEINSSLSEKEQNKESDQRYVFYHELCDVSDTSYQKDKNSYL